MKRIVIKRQSFTKLCTVCSLELIDYVFGAFKSFGGIIVVDEENQEDDIWELENFHNETTHDKLEIMKVMSSFGQYGMFNLNGRLMFFDGVVLMSNHKEGRLVMKAWYNYRCNGMTPYFNMGELKIPRLMPRYTYTQISDVCFRIDRWEKNKYIPTKLYFPTLDDCLSQIDELENNQ